MFSFVLRKIFGTQNERELKRLEPVVEQINNFESQISKLRDDELRAKTDEFKEKIREKLVSYRIDELSSEEKKRTEREILDEMLPEAFAVVREAGKRTVGMKHFDVQLMGGIVLHQGRIAEMATGEGKTLVATLAVYLNALTGKGVHVVTVNDYLARRDREWMGPIYEFLGLTVGVIQHDIAPRERQRAYGCDVTYGTNNEFGFDYLRDNMIIRKEDMVQREPHYAIVDEVDSILVDEARTPLIISGPAEESTDKYYTIDKIIPKLKKGSRDETTKEESGDYVVDEKAHTAYLTEEGELHAAKLLGLDDLHSIESMEYKHHINQALKAHTLFQRDVDYVVKEKQVIIVDEFTGRMMPGRRWSDGLHQAIEAKEGVKIERENQTLATVTFQNYFRMYEKLAGMTGTAATEAAEFRHIYKLDVVVIPTNRPLIRTNHPDVIYKSEREKFDAVADEIIDLYKEGRPVLVGTISIDKSERVSELLRRKGIPHNVLNAKYHEMEAHIVAQAGRLKTVTIATNMAGRGTDILLGGNVEYTANDMLHQQGIGPYDAEYKTEREKLLAKFKLKVEEEHRKVVELGGLHIIGTERHEARRIDNQLRGRAGRQGDPGSSRFYLSLEDDLMRIFGSDRLARIYDRLGIEEGQDIQHPLVTRAIETAQKRVETHNFDIRKQLLEYDNVMNRQREVIYAERKTVLESENLREHVLEMIDDMVDSAIGLYLSPGTEAEEGDISGLIGWVKSRFGVQLSGLGAHVADENRDQLRDILLSALKAAYEAKEKTLGAEAIRWLEKEVLLQVIDSKWKDHLYAMDNMREGIGLRAYGQRDPLVEYQHEGYEMFSRMIESIKEEALEFIFKIQPLRRERLAGVFSSLPQEEIHPETVGLGMVAGNQEAAAVPGRSPSPSPTPSPVSTPYHREGRKVGRNEPCPCGSGKKYKKCCGK